MMSSVSQLYLSVRKAVLSHGTAHQFMRFCIVGGINTATDFTAYLILTRGLGFGGHLLAWAAALSYCCGAVTSFFLNNFWTFRKDGNGLHSRLPKFIVVTAGGAAWNAIVVWTLLQLGVFDLIAKVFATALVIFWNFTLMKKWAFRK